jgi:hypothetical protein
VVGSNLEEATVGFRKGFARTLGSLNETVRLKAWVALRERLA